VYTALGTESCGYTGFKPGERYLVSAYGSPDKLETGYCEMTKPIDLAAAELEELGAGREPAALGGSVSAAAERWLLALGFVLLSVAVGFGWHRRQRR